MRNKFSKQNSTIQKLSEGTSNHDFSEILYETDTEKA